MIHVAVKLFLDKIYIRLPYAQKPRCQSRRAPRIGHVSTSEFAGSIVRYGEWADILVHRNTALTEIQEGFKWLSLYLFFLFPNFYPRWSICIPSVERERNLLFTSYDELIKKWKWLTLAMGGYRPRRASKCRDGNHSEGRCNHPIPRKNISRASSLTRRSEWIEPTADESQWEVGAEFRWRWEATDERYFNFDPYNVVKEKTKLIVHASPCPFLFQKENLVLSLTHSLHL